MTFQKAMCARIISDLAVMVIMSSSRVDSTVDSATGRTGPANLARLAHTPYT